MGLKFKMVRNYNNLHLYQDKMTPFHGGIMIKTRILIDVGLSKTKYSQGRTQF